MHLPHPLHQEALLVVRQHGVIVRQIVAVSVVRVDVDYGPRVLDAEAPHQGLNFLHVAGSKIGGSRRAGLLALEDDHLLLHAHQVIELRLEHLLGLGTLRPTRWILGHGDDVPYHKPSEWCHAHHHRKPRHNDANSAVVYEQRQGHEAAAMFFFWGSLFACEGSVLIGSLFTSTRRVLHASFDAHCGRHPKM